MAKKKTEINYNFFDRKIDLDHRIDHLENMCVKHILRYKNIIYSPINRDTILITNKLQGLFFNLLMLLKEKRWKTRKSNYDYYAKFNPDKYNDNIKLQNIKGTRSAGYMIYGGFIDIDRDVDYKHKDDYREVMLDLFKSNIFHIKKNLYYKFYGTGKNVDIKYIHIDDYIKAHLSIYKDEHRFNYYHMMKKKMLWWVFLIKILLRWKEYDVLN